MAIIPFVDFGTLVLIVVVMFTLDMIAYMTKIGVFYIAAGVLGVYTDGAVFAQQALVQSTVYNIDTASFVQNKVDPNLAAVLIAVVTICSFYFVYWETRLT